MKRILFILLSTLIFCCASPAQIPKPSDCPAIYITGSNGIATPNEPIIFTASIGKEVENFDVKYEWTAANGEITEGQGTLTLKVLHKDTNNNLTVTFRVIGLPKDCRNVVSITMSVTPTPQALLIEELSTPIAQIEKAEIFEKPNILKDNANDRLHIIIRYKRNTPQKFIVRTERKIFNNLLKSGIQKKAIVLIKDAAATESIQFWLVPTGATPPTIKD